MKKKKNKEDFLRLRPAFWWEILLSGSIVSVTHIAITFLLRMLIDQLKELGEVKIAQAVVIITLLIVVYTISLRLYYKKKTIMIQDGIKKLQELLLERLYKADYSKIEIYGQGNWATNVDDDCQCAVEGILKDRVELYTGILKFFVTMAVGVYYSAELTAVIFFFSAFSMLGTQIFGKPILESKQSKQHEDTVLRKFLENIFKNINVLQIADADVFICTQFFQKHRKYSDECIRNVKFKAKLMVLNIGIGLLTNTGWIIIGIFFIYLNKLTIGELFVFMILSDVFIWPFMDMPKILEGKIEGKAAYQRIKVMCNLPEAQLIKVSKLEERCFIESEDLTFQYDCSSEKGERKNLYYPAQKLDEKEIVALIGESGSGKSTLLKVLLGLYEPVDGQVIYQQKEDGAGISVAYVPQQPMLFSGSIRENVALGCMRDVTDDEVIKALEKASAMEFIQHFPNGINTQIGFENGTLLSGGQQQRIAIARAYMMDADVLFFDEMTAALDVETEKKVLETLRATGKAVMMVTHREEALNYCDRIELVKKLYLGESESNDM